MAFSNTYRHHRLLFILFILIGMLVFSGQAQDDSPITTLPDNLQVITADNFDQLQLLGTIRDRYVVASYITWAPDSSQFVVSTSNGFFLVQTNDLLNGQILPVLHNVFSGVDFADNDSSRLAIAGEDGIYVFNLRENTIATFIETEAPSGKILFSPDANYLASEDNEIELANDSTRHPGEVTVYEVESGEVISRVGYPYSSVILNNPDPVPFAFSMDGTQLLTGREGLHAWDYINTQDYRDPNLMSKAEYLDIITNITMQIEDSPTFSWVGYSNSDGLYALWLTAEDGEAYFSIQDGGFEVVVPSETGEGHDENGIPSTVRDFTQLERRDLVRGLQTLSETPFETPVGSAFITRMGEAALLANLYAYDVKDDTLTNQQTGLVYTPTLVFGAGRYEDNTGQPVSLSGGGLFQHYYYVDEGRLPDLVIDDLIVTEFAISPDKNLMAIFGRSLDSGDHELRLLDSEGNQTLLNVPESLASNFNFNLDGSLLIANWYDYTGIAIWDLSTFELIIDQVYEGDERLAAKPTFSSDGRILVRHGQEIQFWGVPE